MSKQVTAEELAEIVTRLLTANPTVGELDSHEAFQGFMTDIAQVVCNYCGGEIQHPADSFDDIWYVGIHGNSSLPDDSGGVWRDYDKEGELFSRPNDDEILALANSAYESHDFGQNVIVVGCDGWEYTTGVFTMARNVYLENTEYPSEASSRVRFQVEITGNKVTKASVTY